MNYYLSLPLLQHTPEITLTQDEFQLLVIAKDNINNAFHAEDNYEALISNYLEFEKEVLQTVLTNSVRRVHSYIEFYSMLSGSSTKLINFLSSASHFLEQLPRHFNKNSGVVDFQNKVESKCSYEYDNNFEYRFMQALRNHTLHYPILNLYLQPITTWTANDKSGLIEHSSKLLIKRDQLIKNDKFKKSVLDEMPEEINLIYSARKYLECISNINQFVRDITSNHINDARNLILEMHKRYSTSYEDSTEYLSAYQANNKIISEVSLSLLWDEVRIGLQNKNSHLVNLSKKYVTNITTNNEA